MKLTSILSICTLALATAASANHGQFEHKPVAPTQTGAQANKPAHHWAVRGARKHFEHPEPKPTGIHHWIRAMYKGTTKPDIDKADLHFVGDAEGKPEHHYARDAADHPMYKPEPMHTGGAVAGKPGHHFVRSAGYPNHNGKWNGNGNWNGNANGNGNPYAGTKWTPSSAISSVRGILTGGTGLQSTCERCIAAMQVGQSLAKQSSTHDFSHAVVGLCQQVNYRSSSACTSSFGPGQVGPYIQTLVNANIAADGQNFCKAYFNAC